MVVPADSHGRQHAESGQGGLWFSPPGELVWCVEALLNPEVHGRLGAQGRRYALSTFGSLPDFADRAAAALGAAIPR